MIGGGLAAFSDSLGEDKIGKLSFPVSFRNRPPANVTGCQTQVLGGEE